MSLVSLSRVTLNGRHVGADDEEPEIQNGRHPVNGDDRFHETARVEEEK